MPRRPVVFLQSALLLATLFFCSCSTVRTTTTTRTSIEQALLSQAVENSISQMDLGGISGKTYCIKKDYCAATDCEFLLGTLNRRLLEAGGLGDEEKSSSTQLMVYPVVAHSAIDDSSILIGLPDIPLAVPGVGAVTIPEAAFYKHVSQTARNRMSVYARERKTGRLAFASEVVSTQQYYDRWVILFVFHFRTTSLKPPH